jgi:hypothetical protein
MRYELLMPNWGACQIQPRVFCGAFSSLPCRLTFVFWFIRKPPPRFESNAVSTHPVEAQAFSMTTAAFFSAGFSMTAAGFFAGFSMKAAGFSVEFPVASELETGR